MGYDVNIEFNKESIIKLFNDEQKEMSFVECISMLEQFQKPLQFQPGDDGVTTKEKIEWFLDNGMRRCHAESLKKSGCYLDKGFKLVIPYDFDKEIYKPTKTRGV